MDAQVLIRTIGAQVKKSRLKAGLTQKQLAQMAGVSERLIRSLEAGISSGVGLEKLAAILTPLDLELQLARSNGSQENSFYPTASQKQAYSSLLQKTVASWANTGASHE